MQGSGRLVDAGFNRAREGLRVLEDLARFVLATPEPVEGLKKIRHTLTGIAKQWPGSPLVFSRDTAGDVGVPISTPEENDRCDLEAVAAAAGRRATEAMRSLEEIAKVVAPGLANSLESLRYQTYDLSGAVEKSLSGPRPRQWRLCLLLTEDCCHHDWRTVVSAAIDGGVDCIQVREKHLETTDLVARTRQVIEIVGDRPVDVIVNDRVDVALVAGAAGVHLGSSDLTVTQARTLMGNTMLIGATARSADRIHRAIADGASSFGIGPMFTSTTKPDLPECGPSGLRELLPALQGLPHLAIGGIDERRIGAVVDAGGQGVAVCQAICGAADPAEVAGRLRSALPDPAMGEPAHA